MSKESTKILALKVPLESIDPLNPQVIYFSVEQAIGVRQLLQKFITRNKPKGKKNARKS